MAKLTSASAPILLRAQLALGLSQSGMGELLGANRKTISRRQHASYTLAPWEVQKLAVALYPVDAELAAEVAQHGGTTLQALGVVKPAPPAAPPAPTLAHLVDAVVMAAAEANGALSPQLRPTLSAAFERAQAMGLSVAQVAAGLRAAATK